MEGLDRASLAEFEAALPLTLPAAIAGDVDVCVLQLGRCGTVLARLCPHAERGSMQQNMCISVAAVCDVMCCQHTSSKHDHASRARAAAQRTHMLQGGSLCPQALPRPAARELPAAHAGL